jgi:hypothetical protein
VNTGAHLDQVAIIDLGGPEPGAFHDVYRKYSMRERLQREHGTAANQVLWEGQTPLLGDVRFAEQAITAMDEWLRVVEADRRKVPLSQKVIDAKGPAGMRERCVATDGAEAPLQLCDTTVDPTIFSSPRIEAGGGDQAPVNGVGPQVVGFPDDRLDCQTMPIEQFRFAGKSFSEVFSAAQQDALRVTFPTGVCDYSKPGRGFQEAVTWLTYQDAAGQVVVGGRSMGAPPTSVYFVPTVQAPPPAAPAGTVPPAGAPAGTSAGAPPGTSAGAPAGTSVGTSARAPAATPAAAGPAAATGRPGQLPATGGVTALTAAALALLVAGALLRRRFRTQV